MCTRSMRHMRCSCANARRLPGEVDAADRCRSLSLNTTTPQVVGRGEEQRGAVAASAAALQYRERRSARGSSPPPHYLLHLLRVPAILISCNRARPQLSLWRRSTASGGRLRRPPPRGESSAGVKETGRSGGVGLGRRRDGGGWVEDCARRRRLGSGRWQRQEWYCEIQFFQRIEDVRERGGRRWPTCRRKFF